VNGSEFLFEWDLQNIDLSPAEIFSPEFSFQGSKFYILLQNKTRYGCFLRSVETSSRHGGIHFRFDLVKRLDNAITILFQGRSEFKELRRGRGVPDRIDPATIQDHILNVKIWTSEYDFVFNLEHINITVPSFSLPFFFIGGIKLYVFLKMSDDGSKYGCYLINCDSAISSKVQFQVDLFERFDNRLIESDKLECAFDKTNVGQGFKDWVDVETIRDHIIKVNVLPLLPVS
jgi:hypothetical protein